MRSWRGSSRGRSTVVNAEQVVNLYAFLERRITMPAPDALANLSGRSVTTAPTMGCRWQSKFACI